MERHQSLNNLHKVFDKLYLVLNGYNVRYNFAIIENI